MLTFQFHIGAIISRIIRAGLYFIAVRFNSILVQLYHGSGAGYRWPDGGFQFHIGAIISSGPFSPAKSLLESQFHIGVIISLSKRFFLVRDNMFQFHIGAIISPPRASTSCTVSEFQFHIGAIISGMSRKQPHAANGVSIPYWCNYIVIGFHLGEFFLHGFQFHIGAIISRYTFLASQHPRRCFNSILVQLYPPYIKRDPDKILPFQFHIGAIISRPISPPLAIPSSRVSIPYWCNYIADFSTGLPSVSKGFNSILVQLYP